MKLKIVDPNAQIPSSVEVHYWLEMNGENVRIKARCIGGTKNGCAFTVGDLLTSGQLFLFGALPNEYFLVNGSSGSIQTRTQ